MATIYSRAAMVLAWVGPADEHSSVAAKVTQNILKFFLQHKDKISSKHYYYPDKEKLEADGFIVPTPHEWCCWIIQFTRRWFERAWIIQEAGLAKKIVLLIGLTSIHLKDMILAYKAILMIHYQCVILQAYHQRRHMYLELQHTGRAFTDLISGSWLMQNVLDLWDDLEAGQLRSFCWVSARLFQASKCMDPRDKVYATMGIAREFQSSDGPGMVVDYSEDIPRVFARASKYIIHKNRDLEILELVAIKHNFGIDPDLPSWCPNFDKGQGDIRKLNVGMAAEDKPWRASGGSSYNNSLTNTPWNRLCVQGCRIDAVRTVSCTDISHRHSHMQHLNNFVGMIQIAAEVAEAYVVIYAQRECLADPSYH